MLNRIIGICNVIFDLFMLYGTLVHDDIVYYMILYRIIHDIMSCYTRLAKTN